MRPNFWILCHLASASSTSIITMCDQFVAVRSDANAPIFVHVKNSCIRRRALWVDLLNIPGPSICIMGDFNVVLGVHECSSGSTSHRLSIDEFQEFIATMDLLDIEDTGNEFTWIIHRNFGNVSARLDRAL